MEKTANKQKMHGGKIALYVIAILWTVVTLFPVVVTVMASFKIRDLPEPVKLP